MTEQLNQLLMAWWANNPEELDLEIARLAQLCQVRLLDAGVIERVLQKDASVCHAANPIAFAKLRDMLLIHFALRKRATDASGPVPTAQIIADIAERLKRRFGDALEQRVPA